MLLLPWLGHRWATEALVANPTHAVTLAKRAHAVDPFLVEPYWAQAHGGRRLGGRPYSRGTLAADAPPAAEPADVARRRRSSRWQLRAARTRPAHNLERYTELDPKAAAEQGGDATTTALKRVNNRQYRC